MVWIYYILLLLVQIAGLVVALFQLPGLWLMLAGVGIYAWVTAAHGYVSVSSLIVLFMLTLLAEVVEFVAGGAGAKKAGASKLGMVAAMVGDIVGAIAGTPLIPIPVIGTIVGACVGSFIGAMAIEWIKERDVSHSVRVGYGAAKGRFLGMAGKLTIGVVILVVTIVVALPVGGIAPPPVVPTIILLPTTAPATLPAKLPTSGPATIPTTSPAGGNS
ncbi:hypothetical protein BH10PLA1_BH10PLA1_17640 [soil metagenome]